MNLKKIIEEQKMSDFPIGLGGCRLSENYFDSCGFDMVVFDGKSDSDKIIQFDNELVSIHHATFSETQSKKLLQYDNLQIILNPVVNFLQKHFFLLVLLLNF